MQTPQTDSTIPSRILYSFIPYSIVRVSDLERAVNFYTRVLGMTETRREHFTEGRFTLVFLGYGDEASNTVIELTHNWDPQAYQHGTGYGHLALAVEDIYKACERFSSLGVAVLRTPGPMRYGVDATEHKETIAFIEDPDGYRIELIESKPA